MTEAGARPRLLTRLRAKRSHSFTVSGGNPVDQKWTCFPQGYQTSPGKTGPTVKPHKQKSRSSARNCLLEQEPRQTAVVSGPHQGRGLPGPLWRYGKKEGLSPHLPGLSLNPSRSLWDRLPCSATLEHAGQMCSPEGLTALRKCQRQWSAH